MAPRLSLLCLVSLVPWYASAAPVDFAREVLPIFSDACFHCHGPDAKNGQKAGLRLDTKAGVFRTKDGVTPVKPGNPGESELVLRILSADREEVMPPPKAHRQLTTQERATLKRWVEEGAPWGRHWAFEPVGTPGPPLPVAGEGPRAHHAIDRFVAARVAEHRLGTLAPEAGRERLLRRASLDLTGLPPTPAEMAAFLGDTSPEAYARVIDRLLASPRFGERLATEWLDLARFADTHGFQMDAPRDMSPWRDWVIQAFNRNLPFDQFVTWQLAGDLLPGATREQVLATAFNRLHTQNEEGGIVAEEFRVAGVVDRVNTFGTAFLGLTLECTRCHDHKFDPITQRDYYALFSLFQNIEEPGAIAYSGVIKDMPPPALALPTVEQEKALEAAGQKVARLTAAEAQVANEVEPRFISWLAGRAEQPPLPGEVARFAFDEQSAGATPNAVDAAHPGREHESPPLTAGRLGQAVALGGDDGFSFPGVGEFSRTDPFTLSLWLRPGPPAPHQVVLHRTRWAQDAASRGYELLLEQGKISVALNNYAPANALKIVSREPLPSGEWQHLTVTYDGTSRASGLRLYVQGMPAETEVVRDALTRDITSSGEKVALALGYRDRDTGGKGSAVDELRIFNRALTGGEVDALAGGTALAAAWRARETESTAQPRELLRAYYLANGDEPLRAARARLQAARQEESQVVQGLREVMVMQETTAPKKAYVLQRGAYDAPGEEVTGGTPAFLPGLPPAAPRNRLGLAQWLFQPEQPLLARVTVNRLWQMMFGRGLVESSDNFGLQGSVPTHPELLDWLAQDFRRQGWDVKAVLREIALSATYRQESRPSPAALQLDPGNQWLSHAPARRLSAEMLRDQALADAGLLAERVGGPSVRPYQPAGLWEIAMGKPAYSQSHGTDLYRRSLYTFIKRTVPPPALATFDAADRSYCTVRRQSTSTPLQALALLDDVQLVEAARSIGQRMLLEGGATREAQLAWGFALVSSRRASEREQAILGRLFAEQLALFTADEAAARRLLAVGEARPHAALPPAELAAATVLAQALLNSDEALMRR